MKNKKNNSTCLFYLLGLTGVAFTILVSCSSTSSIRTVGNPDFEIPSSKTAFYSPATNTTPVIQASTAETSLSFVTTSWDSGNPVYEIFNAFQEYTYPDDEGVIDVSNIYKLLFEAGNTYNNAVDDVTALTAATAIASPFDFGNDTVSYTHASDSYALAKDGDTVSALLTWIWDESPKMSYGVIEGTFNETTGDLSLDMVYLVDYEGDSDYCLRMQISGNESTHQFTVKTSKTGSNEGSYSISMIGTGVSQSESEDDYFLLKIIDNDNLGSYTSGRYYKFSSSADEDTLRAHEIDGYALEDIVDPNGYADTIEAMTFFALDGSDHALTTDDFTSTDLTLDY